MTASTIKYGIIGTGGMANSHAEHLSKIEGVELAACLDINAERSQAFAEKHGFAHAVTEMPRLLEQCDAVSVVTPDAFHASISLQVLASNDTHLLCEKPLTTTLEDAREVAREAQRAADDHGIVHMVNFSYRNAAAFQRARELVVAGELGEIRHVTGRYFQQWLSTDIWDNWTSEQWLWRIKTPKDGGPASGGVLGDVGCHLMDFVTGIAGDADRIRCRMRTFPKIHPETGAGVDTWDGEKLDANDTVTIELDLTGGGLGALEASRWTTGHPNQVACGVYGTKGAIEIDLEDSYTKLRTCLGENAIKAQWHVEELDPTPNNWERFITSIRTGVNDQADVIRGAQIQSYLDACERSAEADGAPMTVEPWI